MPADTELVPAPHEPAGASGSTQHPADGARVEFRRELTPAWLSTVCLLAGQRPPDLARPFRYAHLGNGSGATAAAVAAVHPDAAVWAWDGHASGIESTRRLRDAEGLANLVVHERPGLPSNLGGDRGEMSDIVVLDDVMVHASDELREAIVQAIRANLRPGGLVCVSYKTTVGWIEIAPVVVLMRHVAQRYTGEPAGLVDHVLDLLATLRAGGARHLTERPAVAAWLDELAVTDDSTIVADYLRDPFRPLSHAQLTQLLAPTGCAYVGSARLTDELELDVPPPLAQMVATAPSRLLREAYRDLAVRRTYRLDVFRLGDAPLSTDERSRALGSMRLADLDSTADHRAGSTRPLGELCTTGDDAAVRTLLTTRAVYPMFNDTEIDGIALMRRYAAVFA